MEMPLWMSEWHYCIQTGPMEGNLPKLIDYQRRNIQDIVPKIDLYFPSAISLLVIHRGKRQICAHKRAKGNWVP